MAWYKCINNEGGLASVNVEQIVNKRVQLVSSASESRDGNDSSVFFVGSISDTDYSEILWTYTATDKCYIKIPSQTDVLSSVGSGEGYISIEINGNSVYKKYLTYLEKTTLVDLPNEFVLENGDTFDLIFGFDNNHTNCGIKVYTAISIIKNATAVEDTSCLLFKNGQWYNQDKIEITAPNTSIVNGKLYMQGESGVVSGIVTSDLSGLTEDNYIVEIIYDFSSTTGGNFQYGRCNPTSDLSSILKYGTNRKTFENYTLTSSNSSFVLSIKALSTDGIFAGVEATGYINEIRFNEANITKTH